MPESVIYVNKQWHTGQLRDASFQLATSSRQVLGHVIPRVAAINPDLDWFDGTLEVRKAFVPGHVPGYVRRRWEQYENFVFRFLASLPFHNTPGGIDRKLTERLQMFEYFRSPAEASKYLSVEDERLRRLQMALENGIPDTFRITAATYEQSRLVRLALYEGDYFARIPT